MSLYRVERLGLSIGGRPLLRDVGFSVEPGGLTALVGASGSGKSLSALAPFGLVPGGVLDGVAEINSQPLIGVRGAGLRALRRRAGFVFQQPLTALPPHYRVGSLLAEAMCGPGDPRPDRAALLALLDRVELGGRAELLDRHPHRLSGGERQRVLIAAAIAHHPRLLIADEPTSALDPHLRGALLALIDRLRDQGMGVLMVSHDLTEVARRADRLVVIDDGRVAEAGVPAAVIAAPQSDAGRVLLAPLAAQPLAGAAPGGGVLLSVEGLGVDVPDPGWRARPVTLIDGVSLELVEGEALAIVGESGSGKSTLARAVAGLGPVTRGRIGWRGRTLAGRPGRSAADRALIQPVFQDPVASLDPRWPLARSIAEPLRHLRPEWDAARRDARVAEMLEMVELGPDFADRLPAQLSGGQAQRGAIARALAVEPGLLVLDEATSGLDAAVAARIVALLMQVQREHGMAMLVVTHDLALAARCCHRIAVMEQGRLVECGPARQVIQAPLHDATRRLVAPGA